MCPDDPDKTDLNIIEKGLKCLKELQARNYSITCQDINCVSREATIPAKNIDEEYVAVKSLM